MVTAAACRRVAKLRRRRIRCRRRCRAWRAVLRLLPPQEPLLPSLQGRHGLPMLERSCHPTNDGRSWAAGSGSASQGFSALLIARSDSLQGRRRPQRSGSRLLAGLSGWEGSCSSCTCRPRKWFVRAGSPLCRLSRHLGMRAHAGATMPLGAPCRSLALARSAQCNGKAVQDARMPAEQRNGTGLHL